MSMPRQEQTADRSGYVIHTTGKRSRSRRLRRRLSCEQLERRELLATVVIDESIFDPQVFVENVASYLDFNTVGYSVGVSHNGVPAVAEISGGVFGTGQGRAVTAADTSPGDLPIVFTTDTRVEVASVTKMLTTFAVLHALDNTFNDLDAALSMPISQFLPSSWQTGNNVSSVTVRNLLTHTSGFQEQPFGPANPNGNQAGVDFNSFANNTFANLQTLVAAALPAPSTTLPNGESAWPRSYNNANFALLAKMLPYIPGNNNAALDAAAAGSDPDSVFGPLYIQYLQNNILVPAGVADADAQVPADDPAIGYNFPGNSSGLAQQDFTDLVGAFGMKLTGTEISRVLNQVMHGSVLSAEARDMMNANHPDNNFLLGWAPASGLMPRSDEFGTYFQHGGRYRSSAGRFLSQAVVFPGDIEVGLVINSDFGPSLTLSRARLLRESYKDAWTKLVIEGDSGDNTFQLQLNEDDPTQIDLIVDSVTVLSNPVDVLQSLELRGLDGRDTFLIEDLPEHIDLVLDGGNQRDVFRIGKADELFANIKGNVTVLGGNGNNDSIELSDSNGLSTSTV